MRRVGGKEIVRNVLIDGNNILRRAQYAFLEKEGEVTLHEGVNINLIKGFFKILSNILDKIHDFTSLHCFFDGFPTRRKNLLPSYKEINGEKRKPLEIGNPFSVEGIDFGNQIEFIKAALYNLNFKVYYDKNEEADDLIASFTHLNNEQINVICSSDKDFFQLVNNKTVLYRPDTNVFYDVEAVFSYFEKEIGHGVYPNEVVLYKCMTGDPSDGIKGIYRFKKRTAASLSYKRELSSLIESSFPGISEKEKDLIITNKDLLFLNEKLLKSIKDIPLVPLEFLVFDVHETFKNLGLSLDMSSFTPNSSNSFSSSSDEFYV